MSAPVTTPADDAATAEMEAALERDRAELEELQRHHADIEAAGAALRAKRLAEAEAEQEAVVARAAADQARQAAAAEQAAMRADAAALPPDLPAYRVEGDRYVRLGDDEVSAAQAAWAAGQARDAARHRKRLEAECAGRLAATDALCLSYLERGEAVPAALLAYRQALRDLPAQAAHPLAPDWPDLPDIPKPEVR